MKKASTTVLLLFFALFTLCLFCFYNSYGCNKENELNEIPTETTYKIEYVIDGKLLLTETALNGETLTAPTVEEKIGFIFKGWYTAEDYIHKWNFETDTVKSNLSLFGYWVETQEETFNVQFMDGDKLLESAKIKKGATVNEINVSEKDGYTFLNWYDGEKIYNFEEPVVADLTLSAKWELNVYTVCFIADENIIEKVDFTVENMQVSAPEVPQKQFYSADWEDYELKLQDLEVNAVYTPIIYTATIIIGETRNKIKYTVEDQLNLPEIPNKVGYTSNWDRQPPQGGDFTIKAIYTPITYYVSFQADNKIIKICEYSIENKDITPPDVPHKNGYRGVWEKKDYETGDITINAVYSIIDYSAIFIIDNSVVCTEYFNVENMIVNEPEIPARAGYSACWENYELNYENIEINAIYTPVFYNAYLLIDGSVHSSIQFTVEDTFLMLPAVPDKQGYTAVWENYSIAANDLLINAIYTPQTYFATFISEGNQIAKVPFTVENYNITIPTPPKKSGYTVKWSEFDLAFEDVTVYAVYEEITVDGGWDESDNFDYEIQSDGSLTVSKYKGNSKNPVVPSTHNGLPVKSIGAQAFSNMSISAVRISEGIEIIQRDAFLNCKSLTTVILPESLKVIQQYAFAYCSFTEIELPEGITEIGLQAFYRCTLTAIKISDSLEVLESVFWFCENLKNVTFGDNLKTISSNAFYNCPALEKIIIPSSVTLIEPEAFTDCGNLVEVHFENSENWIICNENDVPIRNLDFTKISDDITAAEWLTETYSTNYWKKEFN